MKNKVLFLTLVILIFCITVVSAHKPIFEGSDTTLKNPQVVPNHKTSYAVYGEIEDKNDVDFVKFSAKSGEDFYIQITKPAIKSNEEFKPYIALIGKGLYEKDKVPFEIPKDVGVIVFPPSPYQYFYEKFTQTSYYQGQTIRGQIPADGDYYVAVYSADNGGKYTLAIGEEEKFSIRDIVSFPYIYFRVKYFFNPIKTIFISIGVILIIMGVVWFKKKHRTRR